MPNRVSSGTDGVVAEIVTPGNKRKAPEGATIIAECSEAGNVQVINGLVRGNSKGTASLDTL